VNKLINYRKRWYGHVLRKNKEEISKKVLNMKIEGKCQTGRLRSRWGKQDRENVEQKEGRAQKETEEEFWEDRQTH
jgi:hypothetical protein